MSWAFLLFNNYAEFIRVINSGSLVVVEKICVAFDHNK